MKSFTLNLHSGNNEKGINLFMAITIIQNRMGEHCRMGEDLSILNAHLLRITVYGIKYKNQEKYIHA